MKRTALIYKRYLQLIPVLLFALLGGLRAMAHNGPADSLAHTASRFDSLVEDCAARLRALMNANAAYEAAGQTERSQYVVRLGFDDGPNPPNDSTFFQRNASGAPGYFAPGNLMFAIISDSLRKWNMENSVKSYMLYVNGLFFGLDKKFEYKTIGEFFNSPNEQFRVNTDKLKQAHADITKAIFDKVATTDALRRTTVLFSIGSYQSNAKFETRLTSNGTPTDSTWVQSHLLLTAHPKAYNLAETDERKKLIKLVHNAMVYEKPVFTTSRDAINDEYKLIGSALKRVQRHKQILVSTTPNQLDDIFKDFQQSDYMALTLPERVHALKIMAGGAMGNNMYNSREAYAVMMVQHTPDEQQQGLLDKLMTEKASGSSNVLLKDLVSKIDNGHFVNESNDLDEFITSIAKFIYTKYPPRKTFTLDSALVQGMAVGIKPGFWFGDNVSQGISGAGIVTLKNNTMFMGINAKAYDFVYLCFNGNFTIGDKQYKKNEIACVPAVIAQLVFNNVNSSKIKTGLKTVFDLALLLTGVGEIRLAMEAKNAWTVAKALWNMGWGVSDFFINGVFAEKLSETESGRKFLLWYNRVQLVAGGIGLAVSIYDIRQGIKSSRKEFEDDLADNKLKRELEYGNSEVQVTNSEKDEIINNLKKEEDEAIVKLGAVENANQLLHINVDDFLRLKAATTVVRADGKRAINNVKMLVNEEKALIVVPRANSTLQKQVDDYVAAYSSGNSQLQGQMGETISETLLKELDNNTVLNVKVNNSGHGFDAMAFENGLPQPTKIRMVESKPMSGTSVELPNTNNGTQMSTQWQTAKIQEMLSSQDMQIKQLGKILDDNTHLIERYVLTIDKDLKQVILLKLDNF